MFVQVIEGRAADAAALRAAFDRWERELAPGAEGWLGATAGVTDDGRFIALVRFESEEAARRNSDRPEQGDWWAETSRCLAGEATFRDSSDADADLQGDPDRAGFVQVMRGRTADPSRARALMSLNPQQWAAFRPDVLGSVTVAHEEGEWTAAIYFTSEEAAREGERKDAPPELKAQMDELDALAVGETTYFDLEDPWLYSPR